MTQDQFEKYDELKEQLSRLEDELFKWDSATFCSYVRLMVVYKDGNSSYRDLNIRYKSIFNLLREKMTTQIQHEIKCIKAQMEAL